MSYKNKDKQKEYAKKWRMKNPDYAKKYYKKNSDEIKNKTKKRYEEIKNNEDKLQYITAKHYYQQAVMAYKVSDEVIIKHYS